MKVLSTPAVLLVFLTSSGWSQTTIFPFHESFEGSITDDHPVTWLAGGFPATLTATGDDLVLTDPGFVSPELGFSLGLTAVAKHGDLATDGGSSAQTVFRVNEPYAFGSIYTRSTADVSEAYFGNISGSGVIQVGSFGRPHTIKTLETEIYPTDRDVVFQLDTIGSTVTASAWYADEPKPESPASIQFDDDISLAPGNIGVSFGGFGTDEELLTNVSATFRSFDILPRGIANNPGLDGRIPPGLMDGVAPNSQHAVVPEPASCMMLLLGCVGVIACRHRSGCCIRRFT